MCKLEVVELNNGRFAIQHTSRFLKIKSYLLYLSTFKEYHFRSNPINAMTFSHKYDAEYRLEQYVNTKLNEKNYKLGFKVKK